MSGFPDYYSEGVDMDGDGFIDAQVISMNYDTNGDYIVDMTATGIDYDLDGVVDNFLYSADVDMDGIFDTVAFQSDYNGDGTIDYYSEMRMIDTDGDFISDTLVFSEDLNNDNVFETVELYEGSDLDTFLNQESLIDIFNNEMEFDGGETVEGNFDPDSQSIDYDTLVGTPGDDMQHWEYQGYSGPCALYAQMFAYEELTGNECDINELIEVATENGWYTGGGTSMEDMDKILEHLGLETDLTYGNDIDDIINVLEKGGKVVVAVDGDEVWYDDNDTMFTPNNPNHAIEVIGIDYSSGEPMVILNDSGSPDGQGSMIPQDQFVDAWQDSNCLMVEAYL